MRSCRGEGSCGVTGEYGVEWRSGVGVEIRSWGGVLELRWGSRVEVEVQSTEMWRCGVMVYGVGFRTWLKLS